jgi:Sec-independent protein translocase protein TatA
LPGFAEIVLILIVVLFIGAAFKLPEIATAVGKTVEKMKDKVSPPEEDAPDEKD